MNRYQVIDTLGRGSFGLCTLAKDLKTNDLVVLKKLQAAAVHTEGETRLLQLIHHPNVIRYLGWVAADFINDSGEQSVPITTTTACSSDVSSPKDVSLDGGATSSPSCRVHTTGNSYLVLEYADRGDLQDEIARRRGASGSDSTPTSRAPVEPRSFKDHNWFSESQIMFVFMQVLMALREVHSKSIVHRDLKASNVFLTSEGLVKLGDFGAASRIHRKGFALRLRRSSEQSEGSLSDSSNRTVDKTRHKSTHNDDSTMIGSPYYMSPEVLLQKPFNALADIWALGCLLFEMCFLRRPFNGSTLTEVALNVIAENRRVVKRRGFNYSKHLLDLIERLLIQDPLRRPSAEQVLRLPYVRKALTSLCQALRSSERSSHFHYLFDVNAELEDRQKWSKTAASPLITDVPWLHDTSISVPWLEPLKVEEFSVAGLESLTRNNTIHDQGSRILGGLHNRRGVSMDNQVIVESDNDSGSPCRDISDVDALKAVLTDEKHTPSGRNRYRKSGDGRKCLGGEFPLSTARSPIVIHHVENDLNSTWACHNETPMIIRLKYGGRNANGEDYGPPQAIYNLSELRLMEKTFMEQLAALDEIEALIQSGQEAQEAEPPPIIVSKSSAGKHLDSTTATGSQSLKTSMATAQTRTSSNSSLARRYGVRVEAPGPRTARLQQPQVSKKEAPKPLTPQSAANSQNSKLLEFEENSHEFRKKLQRIRPTITRETLRAKAVQAMPAKRPTTQREVVRSPVSDRDTGCRQTSKVSVGRHLLLQAKEHKEPLISLKEVIAQGRANIRDSNRNSPQFDVVAPAFRSVTANLIGPPTDQDWDLYSAEEGITGSIDRLSPRTCQEDLDSVPVTDFSMNQFGWSLPRKLSCSESVQQPAADFQPDENSRRFSASSSLVNAAPRTLPSTPLSNCRHEPPVRAATPACPIESSNTSISNQMPPASQDLTSPRDVTLSEQKVSVLKEAYRTLKRQNILKKKQKCIDLFGDQHVFEWVQKLLAESSKTSQSDLNAQTQFLKQELNLTDDHIRSVLDLIQYESFQHD